MTEAERLILLDFFVVACLALAFAVPVFAMIRRQSPELSWNTHGNVWTSPFGVAEALICSFVFYITWFAIRSAPAEPPEPTISSVLQAGLFFAGLAGIIVFYFWWMRQQNLAELFGLDQLKGTKLAAIAVAWFIPAAAAGVATKLVSDYVLLRAAHLDIDDQTLVLALRTGGGGLKVAIFVSAVFIAPVAEEIIFRGLMYATVKRYTERYFAAVLSSLAFGLLHANLASFAPLVVLGMFFALAYEITGNLAVPVIMHGLFNAASIALILIF